jgi:predicted dehydrogenase
MIRIGVIGYGYWGPNLVRNFAELKGAELAAVADLDPKKLELVNKRFPAVKTTTDFQEMLRDPAIDAIAIATPVSTHFELAMAALKSGKHVWLEKPMTETSLQARQLVDTAEKKKVVLHVDHTFIYTGAVKKMKDLVAADGRAACRGVGGRHQPLPGHAGKPRLHHDVLRLGRNRARELLVAGAGEGAHGSRRRHQEDVRL